MTTQSPFLPLSSRCLFRTVACAALTLAGCSVEETLSPVGVPSKATKPPAPLAPLKLADLGVEVTGSRPFVYTNKIAAYFYGEAAGPHTTNWQGFNVRGFTFIDDWHWTTPSGSLGSTSFAGATVLPDHAVRRYAGGLSERITLLDKLDALLVEPEGTGPLSLRPLLKDGKQADDYEIYTSGDALLVARKNHLTQSSPIDPPVWLAIKGSGGSAAVMPEVVKAGGIKPTMFSPGVISLAVPSPVVFAVADTADNALSLADQALEGAEARKAERAARMQRLIEDTYVVTEDKPLNRAFHWARLSMDALVMDQRGKGILAGLPWFNNYWGRNTFISLPGALLVTGQFEEAREILTSFAEFQITDESNENYGRVPNFVSLDNVVYNTADGTPWFVIQAAEYVAHAGDEAFLETIWPVVERAAKGALRHVDGDGFLKHGDQETWMDASAGAGKEWSPRGDRAVEIQGLWYRQLLSTAAIAAALGHTGEATMYRAKAEALAAAFQSRYYHAESGLLIDHINADGTADKQLRPNQFLALRSFDLGADLEREITRKAAARLVYPYGVASLDQLDDAFHPYHEAPGYYPKDAAYHNGTVWTWLSGPVISLLTEQGGADKAYEQIQSLSRLCLDRGAMGAIPELVDALPREGKAEPNPSGTVFQAWSHAEYLRNVHEDFAGVRYAAFDHAVLKPQLPEAWARTELRFRLGSGHVSATIERRGEQMVFWLRGDGALPASARVSVSAHGLVKAVAIRPRESVLAAIEPERILIDGSAQAAEHTYKEPDPSFWRDFTWQKPALRSDLPALQGPGWPLLDLATIKKDPGNATSILVIDDPTGDAAGPSGTYVYPLNSHFQPGILDGKRVEIREDAEHFYFDLKFQALVQPGWNPPYGFQLTYAALLFDTAPGGQETVGRNAQYTSGSGEGYEAIVFVGGGLLIEDSKGQVLGEYRPIDTDVVNPLGAVDSASISFALPKSVLPALPKGTKVTLLVGSQDDHGGAGIGDFRQVDAQASEWAGGGKSDPGASNVYDLLAGVIGPVP